MRLFIDRGTGECGRSLNEKAANRIEGVQPGVLYDLMQMAKDGASGEAFRPVLA